METIKHYRAVALLCRQQAVLHPEASWQWLAEAERYEHLATAEIDAYFKECNAGVKFDATPAEGARSSLPRDVSLPARRRQTRRGCEVGFR